MGQDCCPVNVNAVNAVVDAALIRIARVVIVGSLSMLLAGAAWAWWTAGQDREGY